MSERWQRVIVQIILSSWLVYAYYTYHAWQSMSSGLPATQPGVQDGMLQRLVWLLSLSAIEAIAAGVALLPRWRRYYALRAAAAAFLLLAIAVRVFPPGASPLDRVYLHWIAFVSILLLNVALVASFLWVVEHYMRQPRR